jgi:hypothetical protein
VERQSEEATRSFEIFGAHAPHDLAEERVSQKKRRRSFGIFGGPRGGSIQRKKKMRIVIAGLRGEDSIAELCRKGGINQNLYYRWSKEFWR